MAVIKTKEGASLWIALLAALIVAATMILLHAIWWKTLCASLATFCVVAVVALFIIRKYVAYKLKPIYSIVLSRDVHTQEIFSELKDKRVENIGEELTAWADTNDREIARLKEAERFRKQYLGNVAHELKTPIFNIQGYISTLLDGGLEDELINRKYLERAEKSIDRLINIVNDLDTISKLESSMNRLEMERFDIVALAREIAEQAEIEADRKGIEISVKGAENLPSPFWVLADKHYIGQVFVNLVINSIRYGKGGRLYPDPLPRHARQDSGRGRGQRAGHRPRGSATHLRAFLPYGQGPFARAGRHGPRTGDRQAHRRGARRADHGAERTGRGQHLLVLAQEGRSAGYQINRIGAPRRACHLRAAAPLEASRRRLR